MKLFFLFFNYEKKPIWNCCDESSLSANTEHLHAVTSREKWGLCVKQAARWHTALSFIHTKDKHIRNGRTSTCLSCWKDAEKRQGKEIQNFTQLLSLLIRVHLWLWASLFSSFCVFSHEPEVTVSPRQQRWMRTLRKCLGCRHGMRRDFLSILGRILVIPSVKT